MKVNSKRRRVLKMGAASAALLAGTGLLASEKNRSAKQLVAMRHNLEKQVIAGGVEGLIYAGAIAANPHNTQPWQFIYRDDCIFIYADLSRQLSAIDCFYREMLLGLGCVIENICTAAKALAISYQVTVFPQGEKNTEVARILLLSKANNEQLASNHAIITRHTNRGIYQPEQPLPATFKQAVIENANSQISLLKANSSAGKRFAQATRDATALIIQNRAMVANDKHWWRASEQDMLKHRDGVSALTAGLPAWKRWFALQFPTDANDAGKYWLQQTEEIQLPSTREFMLIAVTDPSDRKQMLEAGRQLQRVNLLAAQHEVSIQPLNQLFEITDWQQLTQTGPGWQQLIALNLTSLATLQPVFAARLGMSTYHGPKSIRRPLNEVFNCPVSNSTLWQEPS